MQMEIEMKMEQCTTLAMALLQGAVHQRRRTQPSTQTLTQKSKTRHMHTNMALCNLHLNLNLHGGLFHGGCIW
jgi:hypothetical protein